MGRVIFGQGVAEIRGSIGSTTFSKNKGGNYVRNRSNLSQQYSKRRVSNLPSLRDLQILWSQLDASQIIDWNDYALAHSWYDRYGNTKHPKGVDLFITINSNRILYGTATTDSPPLYIYPTQMASCSIYYDTPNWTLAINDYPGVADTFLVVKVSHPVMLGRTYFRNIYRQLKLISYPYTEFINIQSDLNNYFGFTFPSPYGSGINPLFEVGVMMYRISTISYIAGTCWEYYFPSP